MDAESIIDFQKFVEIVLKNKKRIALSFLFFVFLSMALLFLLPKKYISEAKLLLKKSAETNLSDINPYIQSEKYDHEGFMKERNFPFEEIELLKSPLVINSVVRENNIKYTKGRAKGRYVSAKDFVRKNFSVSKIKNTDIIYISYKSKDPKLSYSVVKSVIDNYKKLKLSLNYEKSARDTEFLKLAVKKAERRLDFVTQKLKSQKAFPHGVENTNSAAELSIMGMYDKRFREKSKKISQSQTEWKKLEIESQQAAEELNALKNRLGLSMQVTDMSKETLDIIIIQPPEIMENYDYAEPAALPLIIFCLLGWIASCVVILFYFKI